MSKVSPWHSALQADKRVYQDDTACTEGNNIETQSRRGGTGNLPKFAHCARLG